MLTRFVLIFLSLSHSLCAQDVIDSLEQELKRVNVRLVETTLSFPPDAKVKDARKKQVVAIKAYLLVEYYLLKKQKEKWILEYFSGL